MAALTEQEIMEITNQYIDKKFPTPLGNKRNLELKDKQAIERTIIFAGAYGKGLSDAVKIIKS